MGVNMELEFDKYCKVGRSPKTVLPSPCPQTKQESKSRKEKPNSRNDDYDLLSLEGGGFTEIKYRNYRSVSCKNVPSRDTELESNEVLRRGSVYHGSRERNFRRPDTGGGRKKIEFSIGSETSFSFSILDSICGSDEEAESLPLDQKRSSVMSLNSETVSSGKPPIKPCSLDLKDRQSGSGKSAERDSMENHKFKCDQVNGPSNNANVMKERDTLALNKSLSSKLALPHSPSRSEGDSSKGSPKSRFTPIRKMFDPFTKSKSFRSQLNDTKSSSSEGTGRNKILRKSLLHDFSSVVPNTESSTQPCLPAHLNGNLKMEQKHGVPYFEFSTLHSEDVFVAKTWKAEDALNWVYTFHSVQGRKRCNATGWGMKYSNKVSPMVGQMQVSCYLCSELRGGGGAFSNSMVTEFVLYDIAHARKSVTAEEDEISNEGPGKENVELDDLFDVTKPRRTTTSVNDHNSVDFSTPYPWAPADLHPSLEIASIVVQAPFEKRESLKYKRGDKLDLSSVGQGIKSMHDDNSRVKVNVVTPMGNHSLPSTDESRGPSPLLDRWRLGGGCDCGGWDMACPILVFSNPNTNCLEEHSLLEKDQPLKLYVQGGNAKNPAVTVGITEKGQYAVDFHAQLSTLQAFAVCVAILHTTDASCPAEQEKNKQLLQCSSLRVLVEDEVKILIETATEEEKRKVTKTTEENPTSFVLNPPFSPIARV